MATTLLIAGLPPGLDLDENYTIRLDAIDPSTGATVAGVTISDMSVFARNLGGGTLTPLDLGVFRFLPVDIQTPAATG